MCVDALFVTLNALDEMFVCVCGLSHNSPVGWTHSPDSFSYTLTAGRLLLGALTSKTFVIWGDTLAVGGDLGVVLQKIFNNRVNFLHSGVF